MNEILSTIYSVIVYIFLTYIFLIILTGFYTYKKDNSILTSTKTEKKINKNIYFFIIIPCYNEEKVIGKTLSKLFSNKFNGEVVVIDDDSIDDTTKIIEQYSNNRIKLIKRRLPNAQKGKGDSLNQALRYIEEKTLKMNYSTSDVIVGVLDADGAVSKNVFKELKKHFSIADTDAVQLRVKMYNNFKNMLQVSQDVEFFTVNNIAQITRMYSKTVGLSGNGQFFRLSTVIASLGNSPWGTALLDDYEMTLKLMMHGIKVTYVPDAYVYQEALYSVKKFIIQRSRWVQGNLDCLIYLKPVLKSKSINNTQKIGIIYFLIQPWMNLIADSIIFLLFFNTVHIFFLKETLTIAMMISALGVFFLSLLWGVYFTSCYLKDLKRFSEIKPNKKRLVELPFIISYVYIILFFSIIIAFCRKLFKQNSWAKTERG